MVGTLTEETQSARVPRTLIVVDEAATRVQDIVRLQRYLESRSVPAVILAVARNNEWQEAQSVAIIECTAIIELLDSFDKDSGEDEALLKHLRRVGGFVSAQPDDYWLERIVDQWENSFLTTLYMLVEPTRPPLSAAIRDEFDRLPPIAKDAYKYICLLYQWGLAINLELLARSLGCSYEEFIQDVYKNPHSIGVIVEDVSQDGGIRFRARSRLVAERVVSHIYSDLELSIVDDLRLIAASVLPHNVSDIDTIRALLVHRLGPNAPQRLPMNSSDVASIFDAALEAGMRDSALLHHYGILMRDSTDPQFDVAERYMREALDVLDTSYELSQFRTESRQNLLNSLGMVFARRGLDAIDRQQIEEAEKRFETAQRYFRPARSGEFPNAYPYYSEAWMLWQRAGKTTGYSRLRLLASALQVTDDAKENLPEKDLAAIAEIQAKVVESLSNISNLQAVLSQAAKREDRAMIAAYLTAWRAADPEHEGYSVRTAYKILENALERDPAHDACLRLYSRLYLTLNPADWKGWWEVLQRRAQIESTDGNWSLLFDLGYCACQRGDYQGAREYFESLERESAGHPRRRGIVKVVWDESGEDREFGGQIADVSWSQAWVECSEVRGRLSFNPLHQKFTASKGQRVSFNIALNYRGMFAINLRLLM